MVLEATVICIDNSEWTRSSDFSPSRFEAQQDACNLVCGVKTQSNMENVVGLVSTAGKAVEVHVSLTQDLAKMLGALHKVKISGESDIVTAIQVARLALRHRQNKRQEQRIILFVGSPVNATERELKRLGGQLKKNKIACDIINFGEDNALENQPKLEALHSGVNNHDNSTIITIPPGATMLSEIIASTPIVNGSAGSQDAQGGGQANGAAHFGGVDPNIDPELAMALSLSIETANQESAQRNAPADAVQAQGGNDEKMADETIHNANEYERQMDRMMSGQMTEEEELEWALKLSCETASADRANDEAKGDNEKKDEKKADAEMDIDLENVDSEYMSRVFLDLPGIDPNDPEIQGLLAGMKDNNNEGGDEKNEKSEK
jgi:26S proteasome regulatory subunit N10